jgi:hypothetical protein
LKENCEKNSRKYFNNKRRRIIRVKEGNGRAPRREEKYNGNQEKKK